MTENKLLLQTSFNRENWGNPQVLAAGAKDILLYGNPGKPENYVFRFKLPNHFEIQPFSLNTLCFLTVIEGEILIGEGEKFIRNSMRILPTGGFCSIPENYPVYFASATETILQFHGTGPIDIQYVRFSDDPRKS